MNFQWFSSNTYATIVKNQLYYISAPIAYDALTLELQGDTDYLKNIL